MSQGKAAANTERLLSDDKSVGKPLYIRGPRAPFAWYGGKYYYAKWIIGHFPNHRVYVEPFGGAANILLNKALSEVEVFNDLDGRVINFFRVLRDKRKFNELIRLLHLTPYSRKEFEDLVNAGEPESAVERAWCFFVRCRQSRGGLGMSKLTKSSWAVSSRTRRRMAGPVSKYLSAMDGLQQVAERFRCVVIENMEAKKLIGKHDCREALIYCDPPYLPETRYGSRARTYGVEMSHGSHIEFLNAVKKCKGRVIISGYPSRLYDEMLSDWRYVTTEGKARMANSGQSRTEALWLNW